MDARQIPSLDLRSWADPAWSVVPRRRSRIWRLAVPAGGAAVAMLAGAWWLLAPGDPGVGTSAPAPVTSDAPQAAATSAPPQTRRLPLDSIAQLTEALRASGFAPAEADAIATAARTAIGDSAGKVSGLLQFAPGAGQPQLIALDLTRADGINGRVAPSPQGGYAGTRSQASAIRIRALSGEIDGDSLYTSLISAGVPDSLTAEFAAAFAFDFDLGQEVQKGDTFEVAIEQSVDAAGTPIGVATLVYARLSTRNRPPRSLYRFAPDGSAPAWFDGNGASAIRAFMRTPVDGARITSKFGLRMHPVLDRVKAHNGTDFGAPTGTRIFAAADGTTTMVGPRGAAGNFIAIRHDNGWDTWYMHLNAFAAGLATGQRVRQGQHIGDVGTTGRSTGPHLHYEVHIEGKPVDPLGIRTEGGKRLDGAELVSFMKVRDRIDAGRR